MRSLWLLAALLLPAPPAAAFDFPISDPYLATITAAALKADEKDQAVRYQDFAIRPLPQRDTVPFYGRSRNKVTVRFWKAAAANAPLAVLVAGLGGAASTSYHNYLAYQLVKRGVHALVLPSPFHWSFALSGSSSGYPGLSGADAADLLALLSLAKSEIATRLGITITRTSLLGVSMGALEAAFMASLDPSLHRVVLVNPPVDPLWSAQAIDRLRRQGDSLDEGARKSLKRKVLEFGLGTLVLGDVNSPAYFARAEELLPTSTTERQYLIGSSLQEFLGALIFTTQQVMDLGVLEGPVATTDPNPRLAQVEKFSFGEYLNSFLLPALARRMGRAVSLDEVVAQGSLTAQEAQLRADERVHVFHNADDFIVNESHLSWLNATLGPRATVFPRGGHLGNLWHPEARDAILGALF